MTAAVLFATVPALTGLAAPADVPERANPSPSATPSSEPEPSRTPAAEGSDHRETPAPESPSPLATPSPAASGGDAATSAGPGVRAAAGVRLTRLGTDPFVNGDGIHRSVAVVDTFHSGSTIVAVGGAGPFADGGATGIVFATSADNGVTWTRGVVPGLTRVQGGPYERVGHPVVGFDARHDTWLVSSLAVSDSGGGAGVVVSRSTDGGRTWSTPVLVSSGNDPHENWIVCDTTPSSPFYGNCYSQWSDRASGDRIKMSRSADGGLTWEPASETGDRASGVGGQPVVQRDGTVIVPFGDERRIRSFRSADGGSSWRASVPVAEVRTPAATGPRTPAPPSAEIDAAGRVYVVWQDCRFQDGCAGNDIVMSTSANGIDWGPVTRVTDGEGDHFDPGIGVDRSASDGSARLAVAYRRRSGSGCAPETCRFTVEYVTSTDGGASWSAPVRLAGPMDPSWLPGAMRDRTGGDRISTSVVPGGNAYPVFSAASANSGTTFAQHMFTVTGGLPITGGTPAPAPAAPTALRRRAAHDAGPGWHTMTPVRRWKAHQAPRTGKAT
ncbi:exo-alpha-sialidase [Thermopolyspora sp. NPDC052614]|uniref:sialidase family protein n=1 Tax=Thermopolyspora sp. NPDC052614 TaxID=3155682 RepID=UPI00342DAAA6